MGSAEGMFNSASHVVERCAAVALVVDLSESSGVLRVAQFHVIRFLCEVVSSGQARVRERLDQVPPGVARPRRHQV